MINRSQKIDQAIDQTIKEKKMENRMSFFYLLLFKIEKNWSFDHSKIEWSKIDDRKQNRLFSNRSIKNDQSSILIGITVWQFKKERMEAHNCEQVAKFGGTDLQVVMRSIDTTKYWYTSHSYWNDEKRVDFLSKF